MRRLTDVDRLLSFIKHDAQIIAPEEHSAQDIIMMIQTAPTVEFHSNDPLTLEDLFEMEGEPVYDALEDRWFIVEDVKYYDEFYSQIVMTDGTMLDTDEDGESCFLGRLYRRKLEEERDTVPPKTADWAEHFKARFERVE